LCGEVAHAAVLCPSFYRASIIANPTWWDRAKQKVRGAVIGWLQRRIDQEHCVDAFSTANRKSTPDQVRDRLSPENSMVRP
jgi:hypothetical protein